MNKEKIENYYNNQLKRFVKDFLTPNIRIENAIKITLKNIPKSTNSFLDLGFGLGWSSYEIAKHFPKAKVEGFDISEELTKTAKNLFKASNLSYQTMDLTQDFPKGKFDVIILLDVFEHIPISARKDFYENIQNALNENGRVILTCPTVYHQNYLRENKPEGLQPIDENIDISVLLELASNTKTTLSYFEYLDIWNSRDYFLAIIERPYKFHTDQFNHFENKISLLDFYAKYSLLKTSKLPPNLIPNLTMKQKLKYKFKSIPH